MTKEDEKLIEKLKTISKSGRNAEVKMGSNGKWVIYDVKKHKTTVE